MDLLSPTRPILFFPVRFKNFLVVFKNILGFVYEALTKSKLSVKHGLRQSTIFHSPSIAVVCKWTVSLYWMFDPLQNNCVWCKRLPLCIFGPPKALLIISFQGFESMAIHNSSLRREKEVTWLVDTSKISLSYQTRFFLTIYRRLSWLFRFRDSFRHKKNISSVSTSKVVLQQPRASNPEQRS